MSQHYKCQKETSQAQKHINCKQTRLDYQEEWFIPNVENASHILYVSQPERKDVADYDPHHRNCPDSIPDVEIFSLPHVEVLHIGNQIKTVQPLIALSLAFGPPYSCDKDQDGDSDQNKGREVGEPVHGIVVILGVGVEGVNIERNLCHFEG